MARGTDPGEPLRSAQRPPDDQDEGLDALLRILSRRASTVIGVTALVVLVTGLGVFSLPPGYKATAEVMLELHVPRWSETDAFPAPARRDGEVAGQVRVMTSRHLLERVVESEELLDDPEFNAALSPPRGLISYVRAAAWRGGNAAAADDGREERARTVEALSQRLSVREVGRTNVVEVAVVSEDRAKAARLANAVAESYIAERLNARRQAHDRASQWLRDQVDALRGEVQAAERAVERYRREAGLVGAGETGLRAQQIGELNSELVLARARRAELDARLERVEALLTEDGAESAAEVLDSRLIQSLRQEEASVLRRQAELDAIYGPRHPKMINVRAELADLRTKIAVEVRKIVQNLRNESRVAERREAALREALAEQERAAARLKDAEVRLRQLEREAEAERAVFATFLARLKDMSASRDAQRVDARLLSRAEPPAWPATPKAGLILVLAFLGGLPFAGAIALLVDRRDDGIRSLAQLEAAGGLPALGMIPVVAGQDERSPADLIGRRPGSAFAEAIHGLRTGIGLSAADAPPRSIMITSSQPREGKSTAALALGRSTARRGGRVLLVEADFRNPRLAGVLRLADRPGLAEVLAGAASLDRALRRDRESALHVLPAGLSTSPEQHIDLQDLRVLLRAFARSYDMVIVDAPPVLLVRDPRVLGRLVEKAVLLVRWRETRPTTVTRALAELTRAGVEVAGCAMTFVDPRRHGHFGEGEEVAFGKWARRYYAD